MPFERSPIPTQKEISYAEVRFAIRKLRELIELFLKDQNRYNLNAMIRQQHRLVMLDDQATT